MTSGKIDRQSPVLQPKRADAPSGPVSTAKVAEVKSKEPENLFGARSKTHDPVTGPDGKAVSTSAPASSLWGQAAIMSAKPPLSALTLKNLSPQQATAKMAELKEKKAELEQRIDGRAKELDVAWSHTGNRKRCEILKGYASASSSLQGDTRTQVDAAVKTADQAQTHQDTLFADAKKLPPSKGADAATVEARHEMAVKLWAARHQTSVAVDTATKTIDNAGLKIERLAMTEAQIDPSQGANSKYGSMLGLVGQYFETTFMMSTLNRLFFTPVVALTQELDRETREAAKRSVIEDHWRERDDLMRGMLKDLSAKEQATKADVANRVTNAVKAGHVGGMNVNEIEKRAGRK